MCNKCVDMFKPVLKNVFKHDTDDALQQWPCLAALQSESSCDSCPACYIPTLEFGDIAELHVDVDKAND
jgi:hypothetical protein